LSIAEVGASVRAALGQRPVKPLDVFVHGTRLLAATSGDLRIAVAGNGTTDLIARAAAVAAAQEGFGPVLWQAPFGAWRQAGLDVASGLHAFAPDIVVVATDWREGVSDLPLATPAATVDAAVSQTAAGFRAVWDRLLAAPGRRVIQHLPAPPEAWLTGIGELRMAASPRRQIALLRAALLDAGPEILFLETAGLPADAAAWFGAKLPFAQTALPDYVMRLRAALRQATGRAKKVLALDLDNTLWGGVIGDDGAEGIELGAGSAKGEAFSAIQAYAKALAARGVILAVCSKNDAKLAAAGFIHPGAVLRVTDFAAFECGWGDKAAALRRVAAALNVGLDSLVFADDNPAECAQVAEALPDVAVVPLGDDPAAFIAHLEAGHWFESQGLTAEDFSRGQAYQARAQAAAAGEPSDLSAFLRGLKMRGVVFRPEGAALARVAQLEGKTNQFNMTTRRYDEAAVRAFAAREDALVLAATLADRFGDHGLVSSMIGVFADNTLVIESWLMSCRVFSRTLEAFFMRAVLAEAAARGATRVCGRYVPTAKNDVVAKLYGTLGFTDLGGGIWERDVAAADFETFVAAG
jgi:FkbH-like protein